MDHLTQILETLSEKHLARQTINCIEDGLAWSDDVTIFTNRLNTGQLKALTGFYGSRPVVKHMMDAYIGRFGRMYAIMHPHSIEVVHEAFLKVETTQVPAIERVISHFTRKYGPVSEERVKELDALADVWSLQDSQELLNLVGEQTGHAGNKPAQA